MSGAVNSARAIRAGGPRRGLSGLGKHIRGLMSAAGEERHSKQKGLSEQRPGLGMGGGVDRGPCGVWEQGKSREEADGGLCQPRVSVLQRTCCPE